MKTFEYRAYDTDGHARKGLIEALNEKDARERLAAEGVLAERVSVMRRHTRFSADLRATVYRELAALLRAGLPLLKALDLLCEAPELQRVRHVLASAKDAVRDGASLADALVESSRSVTPFERAIIEAAERSASVESMMDSLADFLDDAERLRERVHNALVYPAIVFTVGLCVALVMLGVLVPRARDLLVGSDVPLHPLTTFTIGLGRALFAWGPLIIAATVATGLYVWRKWRTDDAFRVRGSRELLRLPIAGRGSEMLINLRFTRTLAILLEGGVSLIDGLVLAGRATGNEWVASLARAESLRIQHGARLSEAVARIPPLAGTLPGRIQVGEAGGGLASMLLNAADRFQERWDRYVTRVLALLEPMLILAIGSFVLLVTLSVLLPIISMSRAVGG